MGKARRRKKKDGVQNLNPKPANYQPTKAELEEDLRLPVSFDRAVKALFAGDKEQRDGHRKSG